MVSIHKLGYIIGGTCDKIHQARAKRELGAKIYLSELWKRNCIQQKKSKLKIIKLPRIPEKEVYNVSARYGGDAEVGYRRFRMDVIEQLYCKKRTFTMKQLNIWLEGICSFEFEICGFEKNLKQQKLFPIIGHYAKPHYDNIYQERKNRGHFLPGA